MKRMFFTVVWSFLSAHIAAAQPVRVYLFTAPAAQFVDQKSKGRADSLKDVRDRMKGKKTLQLVDSVEEADLSVEIIERVFQQTGNSTSTFKPYVGVETTAESKPSIHVTLTAGTYSTELYGSQITVWGKGGVWRSAAEGLASDVEKWVKENHEQLIAGRNR